MKILVVTGASGGHIFPALSFLDSCKKRPTCPEALLVLPRVSIKRHLDLSGYRTAFISVVPIGRKLTLQNAAALLQLCRAFFESLVILISFRPELVVAFGSIVCIPIVFFARLAGVKIMLHEQNVVPGKANMFLARFAHRIAVSFERTKAFFKNAGHKIVVTGNPLRSGLVRVDKKKALEFFGFESGLTTLLVMGGSQGSHRINLSFLEAIAAMPEREKLQVIHLAGSGDLETVQKQYRDLKMRARVFAFIESMEYSYSACDFVVSRAGATTLAELLFFGLPALIIPYPFAYAHQRENASVLAEDLGAVIIEEQQLNASRMRTVIADFLRRPLKNRTPSFDAESHIRLKADVTLVAEAFGLLER
ncbi:MAG: UDP-N-acetylglucosamine--N-acetylmuramyl-(pentapeptide) pyrophosphoryl-undecaprenol N-acetylglucosamine transferase [Candidatus Omnitrophota bacterium]|jgi:UDP-N-acetylglucosamine--N-acetylmuramyl-(pentapeptide) pyrophosphoryl-undecaprenol N-acetylglucosamine transferase